jgi:diguanylate cyclase (GGDEF)-like protein
MGGEEFVMLLPRADASAAARFADGLREALAQTEMGGFNVSMSAGVAEHLPGEALGETLHRADTALLEAKQRGRNRVEVAPG